MKNTFKRILSVLMCLIMMSALFMVFAEDEEEYVPLFTADPEEATYVLGSGKDIEVEISGAEGFEFAGVGLFMKSPRQDELEIKDDAYTAEATTFTIKSDFLETLEEGLYRFGIGLQYEGEIDGVNVMVTVTASAPDEEEEEETEVPKTADSMAVYVMMAVVSVIGLAMIVIAKKRLMVK